MKLKNSTCALGLLVIISVIFSSCQQQGNQEESDPEMEGGREKTIQTSEKYQADLSAINRRANGNRKVTGTATYKIQNDQLVINIQAEGLEPDMMHSQHLHRFEEDSNASCPPGIEADTNNDGVVDLIETKKYAGIIVIPLHDDPSILEINTETYPMSDAQGKINYSKTVNLETLKEALKRKFNIEGLDLSQFVIFIHGVSKDANLPGSAQSLPDVPAHLTLPVACGALEKK